MSPEVAPPHLGFSWCNMRLSPPSSPNTPAPNSSCRASLHQKGVLLDGCEEALQRVCARVRARCCLLPFLCSAARQGWGRGGCRGRVLKAPSRRLCGEGSGLREGKRASHLQPTYPAIPLWGCIQQKREQTCAQRHTLECSRQHDNSPWKPPKSPPTAARMPTAEHQAVRTSEPPREPAAL